MIDRRRFRRVPVMICLALCAASAAHGARTTSFLSWRQTPFGLQAGSIDAADFNRDGFDDLVVLNGSLVELLLADGRGNFSPPLLHLRGGAGGQRLFATDCNADGRVLAAV